MFNHDLVIWKKIVICLVHWITSSLQEKTYSGITWYINWFFICFDIKDNSAAKVSGSDKNLPVFQKNIVKKSLWVG